MPRLTLKALRILSKELDCHSSKDARKVVADCGCDQETGVTIWKLACETSKHNGRKTIQDRDVQPLASLWKFLTTEGVPEKSSKLTKKSLRELAKTTDCNSSDNAVKLVVASGCNKTVGLAIWEQGCASAKANGRKTVLDKDVQGLVDLWKYMSEAQVSGEAQVSQVEA